LRISYNIQMDAREMVMRRLAERASRQYRTAQDMVADGLRQGILSGALESGQPLRQEQIAKDFEVSIVPVREALRRLAGEGLVTLSPNRGATVSEISYEEAKEITEIRIALESLALKLSIPNMTEEDFRRAEEILDLCDAEGDPAAYAALNWRLHRVLCEPTHRPRLMTMIRSLHASFDLYARRYPAAWMSLKVPAQQQHRQILEACRRGDAAAAVVALEHDIRAGFLEVARHMEQQGQRNAADGQGGKTG
jgi:DNA-binding GntR family transcriptional regulator